MNDNNQSNMNYQQPNQAPNMGQNPNVQNNSNEKWICVLAYLIFFVPLLIDSKNPNYRFHANQGLLVALISIVANILIYIPKVGLVLSLVLSVACLVFAIMGIINAYNKRNTPLPIIGNFQIIK